jgi:hypothetical protein
MHFQPRHYVVVVGGKDGGEERRKLSKRYRWGERTNRLSTNYGDEIQ